jgi:hypothetical protein
MRGPVRSAITKEGHSWNGMLLPLCDGSGKLSAKGRGESGEWNEGVEGGRLGEWVDKRDGG